MENKDDWKRQYEIVLEDLERKKASIENGILALKTILGMGDGFNNPSVSPREEDAGSKLQGDSFFRLGLTEAAKKYLAMTRKVQSSSEIAKALEDGGFHTTSKDFANTVTSVLHRHSNNVGEIVRVNKKWGLAEWYPGLKKGRNAPKAEPNGPANDSPENGALNEKQED